MYLQKPDIDLLEAVTEAKIVIRRLTEESNDVHVWKALFDKGCEIWRDIKASSKQRWTFLASYLSPENLLNLTPV